MKILNKRVSKGSIAKVPDIYPEIYVGKDGVGKRTRTPEGQEVINFMSTQTIAIESIMQAVDNEEIYLEFSTEYGGKQVKAIVSRGKLNKETMNMLGSKGFPVFDNETFFKHVVAKLENRFRRKHAITLCCSSVGWQTVDIDGKETLIYKADGKIGEKECVYKGDLAIKPKGTLENQLKLISEHVMGVIPCEAVYAIGLSSVLNGYIGEGKSAGNIVVHAFGDSSVGKTTAAQIFVSLAGEPMLKQTSLMMSWDSTRNAIINRCLGNRGMPIAFDEISKYPENNFHKVVYALADGKDKERLTKEAKLKVVKETDTFLTTIFSTGEASLLNKCAKENTGLEMRVIELNVPITQSAEHSDAIKKSVCENYGHIAPVFAQYLSSIGKEKADEVYKRWFDKYKQRTHIQQIVERKSKHYALILASAELFNECVKELCEGKYSQISLNVEAILDFFVENEDVERKRDVGNNAYEKISEYVAMNCKRFQFKVVGKAEDREKYKGLQYQEPKGKYLGDIELDVTNKTKEVAIPKELFDEIIVNLGFEDPGVVLKSWKKHDYIKYDTNKNTRRRVMGLYNGSKDRVAAVVLKMEYDEEVLEIANVNDSDNVVSESIKKETKKQCSENLNRLLEEADDEFDDE